MREQSDTVLAEPEALRLVEAGLAAHDAWPRPHANRGKAPAQGRRSSGPSRKELRGGRHAGRGAVLPVSGCWRNALPVCQKGSAPMWSMIALADAPSDHASRMVEVVTLFNAEIAAVAALLRDGGWRPASPKRSDSAVTRSDTQGCVMRSRPTASGLAAACRQRSPGGA